MILKVRFLMKLNKLQINGFNILQNGFFIDFDNASNLSILIGKNGSGKSSILEAVGIIFKSLYKGIIDNILLKGLAQKQRAVLFPEEKNGNKSV